MRLDAYLAPHVDMLCVRIRQTALALYLLPYTSVRIADMAAAFVTTCVCVRACASAARCRKCVSPVRPPRRSAKSIESDLADLITSGKVAARIDAEHGVVHAFKVDQRDGAIGRVLTAGKHFSTEARSLLLRISMERQGLVVKGGERISTALGAAGGGDDYGGFIEGDDDVAMG